MCGSIIYWGQVKLKEVRPFADMLSIDEATTTIVLGLMVVLTLMSTGFSFIRIRTDSDKICTIKYK